MELGFNRRYTHIELDKVSIEGAVCIIEELVHVLLEVGHTLLKVGENNLDSLEVVLGKSSELLNGSEELDKLLNSSAEEIESSKDGVWRKFELLTLWHVHESLLGELILLEIGGIKVDAALQDWNELLWWVKLMVPEDLVTGRLSLLISLTSSDSSEVEDGELAVVDHLIGDLDEESGHSLVGAVVSSDGVDHLDTIHESWKSLLDSLWVAFVQWLDELLQGL